MTTLRRAYAETIVARLRPRAPPDSQKWLIVLSRREVQALLTLVEHRPANGRPDIAAGGAVPETDESGQSVFQCCIR
jgi:hypothetical protein